MIIWGFRVIYRMLSEGTFFCPKESLDRSYKLKTAQRFFTLFFIPIIPLKKLGTVVECQNCKSHFDPQVLEIPVQAEVGAALGDAIKSAVSAVLGAGAVTPKRQEQAVSLVSQYIPGFDDAALEEQGTVLAETAPRAVIANAYEKEGVLIRLTLVALGEEKHLTDAQRRVLETIGAQTFGMSRPHIQGTIDSVVNQANGRE